LSILIRLFALRSTSGSSPGLDPLEVRADLGLSIVSHRFGHEAEIPKSFATYAIEAPETRWTRITSSPNSLGNSSGHGAHPSSAYTNRRSSDVTYPCHRSPTSRSDH
jgi:hypothetical protein